MPLKRLLPLTPVFANFYPLSTIKSFLFRLSKFLPFPPTQTALPNFIKFVLSVAKAFWDLCPLQSPSLACSKSYQAEEAGQRKPNKNSRTRKIIVCNVKVKDRLCEP